MAEGPKDWEGVRLDAKRPSRHGDEIVISAKYRYEQ